MHAISIVSLSLTYKYTLTSASWNCVHLSIGIAYTAIHINIYIQSTISKSMLRSDTVRKAKMNLSSLFLLHSQQSKTLLLFCQYYWHTHTHTHTHARTNAKDIVLSLISFTLGYMFSCEIWRSMGDKAFRSAQIAICQSTITGAFVVHWKTSILIDVGEPEKLIQISIEQMVALPSCSHPHPHLCERGGGGGGLRIVRNHSTFLIITSSPNSPITTPVNNSVRWTVRWRIQDDTKRDREKVSESTLRIIMSHTV